MTSCHQVRIRVPATSANLGPGFDAFGLALTLYDELIVTPGGSGVRVEVSGEGEGEVALDESHLVVRSIRAGLEALGASVPGFTLRCENRIPHGRGLGSSSAAIVGGLAAAYGLADEPVDRERIVVLANEIEGHPDNVAAATLGGFTIAWTEGETARAVRLDPAGGLAAVAYVPDNRVLTKEARGLLPSVVPHSDAAANAGKAALFVAALTGRPELLLTATEDRLHQEYREPAMPESLSLVHKLRGAGWPPSSAGPARPSPFWAAQMGPRRTRRTAGRSTNWESIQSAYRSGRWNPAERGNDPELTRVVPLESAERPVVVLVSTHPIPSR